MARDETSKYSDLMPDGKARIFTYQMEAKSVITFPSGGQTLPGPGVYELTGLAWSGRGKIERVEITTDGGRTWAAARLQEPRLPDRLYALPAAVAFRRQAGRDRLARDRRERLRPADARSAGRRARNQLHLSLQRHQVLERESGRDREQCGGLVFWRSRWLAPSVAAQTPAPDIGRPATPDEIRNLGAAIAPDGDGLPEGSGSVSAGRGVFALRCSRCHGERPRAMSGRRSSAAGARSRRRGRSRRWAASGRMPRPCGTTSIARCRSTSRACWKPPDVYAVVAYILNINDIIADDAVMDARSLPKVRMPNRDGFVADPRPDVGTVKRKPFF